FFLLATQQLAAKRRTSTKTGSNVVSQARNRSKASPPAAKRFWEFIKSVAGAVLIYLVIKTLLMEAFRIPSGSMVPTLLVGDWLFGNKLVYGPDISFMRTILPGYSYL